MNIYETIQNLCHDFHNIFQYSGSSLYLDVFSVGIDATVVVKHLKILKSLGNILRGINTNNFLNIMGGFYGETVSLMKGWTEVNHV